MSYVANIDGLIDTKTGEAYCWLCGGTEEDWPPGSMIKTFSYQSFPILALTCSECGEPIGIIEINKEAE